MSEYTPSEDLTRTAWHQYAGAMDAKHARLRDDSEDTMAEFDRFIAKVKRDAAREALDGLLAKHDYAESLYRDASTQISERHAAFRIAAYRDTHYPKDVTP